MKDGRRMEDAEYATERSSIREILKADKLTTVSYFYLLLRFGPRSHSYRAQTDRNGEVSLLEK